MGLTGYMAMKGGIWKLFNDIPSLVVFLSLSLLVYSLRISCLNRFVKYTNCFSYEWYLVHWLIFMIVFSISKENSLMIGFIALLLSYFTGLYFKKVMNYILK